MIKIAFIGAGSVVFTRELLTDICSSPELARCHIALHDIDADRLATADAVARWTAGALHAAPTITSHLDRREAVDGAQYVINMVQVGMHDATLVDFEIPKRYGLRQTIADSYGIGGIFRGATYLRSARRPGDRHGDGGRRWRVAAQLHEPDGDELLVHVRGDTAAQRRRPLPFRSTHHPPPRGPRGRSLCGDRLRRCGHQPSGVDPAIDP